MIPALIHDPATHRLGRNKPARGAKRKVMLRFGDYLKPKALPAPPPVVDWMSKLPADCGAMGNNDLGDCTAAGYGHAIQVWSANNGGMVTPTDDAVIDFYSGSTGYVRGNASTDNGGDESVTTQFACTTGMALPDGTMEKAAAVVEIDPSNLAHIQLAMQLFGGVYTAIELPVTAQSQDVWSEQIASGPDSAPGSWGGHCIFAPYLDTVRRLFGGITWGIKKNWTFDWWLANANANVGGACYAFVSSLWARPGVVAPSGFDLATLLADSAEINA